MTDSTIPQRASATSFTSPNALAGGDLFANDATAAEQASATTDAVRGPGRTRIAFGAQPKRLDAPERPGFVRRWVNDEPGRIEHLKQRGYEHVLDEHGKPTTSTVGVAKFGGGLTAYLMETPKEFYEEDTVAKDAPARQFDEDMRRGIDTKGSPGQNGRYVPTDAYGKSKIKVDQR